MYCHLLKRIQSTCTTWLWSLNSQEHCREQIYRYCQKHKSLSLHGILSIGCHLSDVWFTTSLNSNLWTALTTQKRQKKLCYITSKNRTALQHIVFSNIIQPLLVTKMERSAFPKANKYQGQM
jgi:hypothetical protein